MHDVPAVTVVTYYITVAVLGVQMLHDVYIGISLKLHVAMCDFCMRKRLPL